MFKHYLYKNYRAFSSLKFRVGRRVTRVGWLVLCAMLIAAALGLDTNLSVAYQTFTYLFCLIIMAIAGSFLFRNSSFTMERILPKFGSVGEKLSYRLVLQNSTNRTQRSLSVRDEIQDPRPS